MVVEEGDELYVSFVTNGRGGVYAPNRTRALRGAGEIIRDLMAMSGIRIDPGVTGTDLNELNRYKLDFWYNEQRKPTNVIREDILPLLPVDYVTTERGLGFVVWRFGAGLEWVVDEINPATRGGARQGAISFSSSAQVVNRLRIDYAQRVDTGEYLRHLVYDAETDPEDPYVVGNPWAAASQARYRHLGIREETITADVVQDGGTAAAILDWMIRRKAQTRRRAAYLLPQPYQHLRLGDIVLWTDDEVAITNALSVVVGVERRPGPVMVRIETLPSWIRDVS